MPHLRMCVCVCLNMNHVPNMKPCVVRLLGPRVEKLTIHMTHSVERLAETERLRRVNPTYTHLFPSSHNIYVLQQQTCLIPFHIGVIINSIQPSRLGNSCCYPKPNKIFHAFSLFGCCIWELFFVFPFHRQLRGIRTVRFIGCFLPSSTNSFLIRISINGLPDRRWCMTRNE